MTTRTITVMFTDLVGSTELLSRVGDDAADGLRRQHFALIRAATAARGGEEIKNLGDGLMIVFVSAADAVTAAADLQRAFDRRNRRQPEPLLVRVGIAAGDADLDDGDYFGIPVVEAARLCAAADGGEVLVTDLVRMLSGSRSECSFEPVGELDLRGLDHPVPACRIGWVPPVVEDRPPLPRRLSAAATDVFVGREVERARMTDAWKAAVGGERRVLLLSGEPGIGKTTLAAHLAAAVHAEDAIVAYGRCDNVGIPYEPWIDALQAVVSALPDDVGAPLADPRDGALAPLLLGRPGGRTGTATDGEDGDAGRFALFAAAVDVLERAALERPVLLVLDDLHWADGPSLQLLRHVVMADPDRRLAVVGIFRSTDVSTGHPLADLLADLHRECGVERIALRGIGDDELLDLLERIAGHEMPAEGLQIRDAVLAETDGNPFFVLEIMRHLAETGAITRDEDGRWRDVGAIGEVGLPVSVKEVVGRRVDALGHETAPLLSLASVIGRTFDIDLLASVAGLESDAVIERCDAAVDVALLEVAPDSSRYAFAHALIGHTLYEEMSPPRRARAHRAVVDQLEVRYGDAPGDRVSELAHHWAAVGPSDATTRVLERTLGAGWRALDQLAPDEALRWFRRAVELLDRGDDGTERDRAEALLGSGIAERQGGSPTYRETLLDAAELADRTGAVDVLVRSAAANTREFSSEIGGIDEERVAVLHRALDRVGQADLAARARLLVVLALELTYRAPLEERLALVEEAIALARGSGDTRLLVQVLQRSCDAAEAPRTLARRTAWAGEAWALGVGGNDLEATLNARVDLLIAAVERGDVDEIRRGEREVEELVRRIPQPGLEWVVGMHRAMLTLLRGDLDAADREIEATYALAVATGQPDPLGVYGPQLVNVRFFQGRMAELLPLLDAMTADERALPAHLAALAVGRCYEHDPDGARSLLDDARAGGFAVPEDQGRATAHASFAEAASRVGDQRSAALLRERLLPYAQHIVTTNITVQPSVAHHLGLLDHTLGHHDAADAWFEMAMGMHRRLDSPVFVAATEVAWAALRADRGDDADARRLATSALGAAEPRGYGYIAADARALLARLH